MSAKHDPKDKYNCLCEECVYESLRRMGGPFIATKTTKKAWLKKRVES